MAQPPIDQNGVKLRDPEDFDSLRSDIFDGVKQEVISAFPKSYGGVRLEVDDVDYEGDDDWDFAAQRNALLNDDFLAKKLKGTVRLFDEATGDLIEERRQSLMRVPWLTQRGTFIHKGNEYSTINQNRLVPGPYTRRTESGMLETHFNPRPGSGRGFRLSFDPESAQYRLGVQSSQLHLYSLLKDLGHSDDDLAERWGPDVLRSNAEKYDARVLPRAYKHFVPAWKQEAGVTRDGMVEAVRGAISKIEVNRAVAQRTLPNWFDRTKSASWAAKQAGTVAARVFFERAVEQSPFSPDLRPSELWRTRAHDHIDIRADQRLLGTKRASIAVDLDGTLAHKDPGPFDPNEIGAPIPAMMERVKKWIADGEEVVIFTARAATKSNIPPVKAWLKEHGLGGLKVTCRKTYDIEEIYDDRAYRVERNTGKIKKASITDSADLWDEDEEAFHEVHVPDIWAHLGDRPSEEVDIDQIWGGTESSPGFSEARLEAADTDYPIILDNYTEGEGFQGGLVDGRHRKIKLQRAGAKKIRAVKLTPADIKALLAQAKSKVKSAAAIPNVEIGERKETFWICPHCKDQIHEKGSYLRDALDDFRSGAVERPIVHVHGACGGEFMPPPPSPEEQAWLERLKSARVLPPVALVFEKEAYKVSGDPSKDFTVTWDSEEEREKFDRGQKERDRKWRAGGKKTDMGELIYDDLTKDAKVTPEKLQAARAVTDEPKSHAQAEAGNYAKGTVWWNGLKIRLENSKGSVRKGLNPDGTIMWKSKLYADYGYIAGTRGVDGDEFDVFIGPHLDSEIVFIVDQVEQPKKKRVAKSASSPTFSNDTEERTPRATRHIRISDLVGHEGSLSEPQASSLPPVWGAGGEDLRKVAQEFPRVHAGHGGAHGAGVVLGQEERERGLHTEELSLGHPDGAVSKQAQQRESSFQGEVARDSRDIGDHKSEGEHYQAAPEERVARGAGGDVSAGVGAQQKSAAYLAGADADLSRVVREDRDSVFVSQGAFVSRPFNSRGVGDGALFEKGGKAGDFDEHKAILGVRTTEEARALYLANFPAGWICGPIRSMTFPQFKIWLRQSKKLKAVADTPTVKMASAAEGFDPDLGEDAMQEAYDAVYGGSKPRLASMQSWPAEWMPPGSDSLGWINWYQQYLNGNRTDDDPRQIKRWKAFKARHGTQFKKNPTPRRAYALRYWAIDPLKMIDDEADREAFKGRMEDYRAKESERWLREKTASLTFPDLKLLANFLNTHHGAGIPLNATQPQIEDAIAMFLGADDAEASAFMGAADSIEKEASANKGCLMVNLPLNDTVKIVSWAQENIPESDLAEDGIERTSHVTVLYGFDPKVKHKDVAPLLPSEALQLKLGKVKRFKADDNRPDSDVLVVAVESEDLTKLNKKIRDEMGDSVHLNYPGYTPHLTLAYVKPGSCSSLDGHAVFDGQVYLCSTLVFSTAGRKRKMTLKIK
jgi:hypothetical protein